MSSATERQEYPLEREQAATSPQWEAGRRFRVGAPERPVLTLVAVILALAWALPLLWVLTGAFKGHFDIVGPNRHFLPLEPTLQNWQNLVDPQGRAVSILRSSLNSFIVASISTAGALIISSMAGYAFARLPFPGRGPLFIVLLGTMMIPFEVILVPLFLQFHRLGLLDTYPALVLPHMVSVLGIFLMRQFIQNVPRDLDEAARIDGANAWQIYYQIILPLTRPALATLAVFVFLEAWNDFLWPLIVVGSPGMQTLPLALITFRSAYSDLDYGTVLASVVLAVTPPLLFFVFAQRLVIQSISRAGLKG